VLDGAKEQRMANVDIIVGPRLGNFLPSSPTENSAIAPSPTPGTPIDCGTRFVPFPETPDIPNPALRVPAEAPDSYWRTRETGSTPSPNTFSTLP